MSLFTVLCSQAYGQEASSPPLTAPITQQSGINSGLPTLNIGITNSQYPPFSYLNSDQQRVGFDVDIAKALCDMMQRQCTLVPMDWEALSVSLNRDEIQAIAASILITDERKERLSFSTKYYQSPLRIVRRKGQTFKFNAKGFKGKRIGVQKDTVSEQQLSKLFEPISTIYRYTELSDILTDLETGKIDMVVAEYFALDIGFLKTAAGQNFEFFGPEITNAQYANHAAIATRKDNQALADEFSRAITKIRQNGTYHVLSERYFNQDIYGY